MNCANCGNQVTNDAKFCNKCGKSIEVNYSNNTILGKVKNHLEFLGYNIKNLESKESSKEIIIASHGKRNSMVISNLTSNIVMFGVNLTAEKQYSVHIDTYINNANKEMGISKVYSEIENEKVILKFESFYIGEYKKEAFVEFVDSIESDIRQFCNGEKFNELFIK
jgi:rRNA maturation endonuclease Nob1